MKRLVFCIIMVWSVASAAWATFVDDFSSSTYSQNVWTVTSGSWGENQLAVANGYLQAGPTFGTYEMHTDFAATTADEAGIITSSLLLKSTGAFQSDFFKVTLYDTVANKGFTTLIAAKPNYWSSKTSFYLFEDIGGTGTAVKMGTSGSLTANEWNTIDLKIDTINGTYKVYLAGVPVISYTMTTTNRIDSVDESRLYFGVASTYNWEVDSISVIPEPATVSLLFAGGILSVVLKRKSKN